MFFYRDPLSVSKAFHAWFFKKMLQRLWTDIAKLETVEMSISIWWDMQKKAMSCAVTAKQAAAKMMSEVASQFPPWEKM